MDFETTSQMMAQMTSPAETDLNSEMGAARIEPFQMRCPHCRKLYSVEPNLLGATAEEFSRFECIGCQTSFLAMKPELHGHQFLETRLLETQFATFDEAADRSFNTGAAPNEVVNEERALALELLPARSTLMAVPLREEFMSAGAQARVAEDLTLAESAELVAMWEGILNDYENLAKHEAFVKRCFQEERLVYASHKYAQILVAAPQEDIARRMRRQTIGLASYGFDATSKGLSLVNWKFPLPSFNNFIILLGTIAVIVGFGLPHAGQAAGLGFAMIALALGLRFFLRKPSM